MTLTKICLMEMKLLRVVDDRMGLLPMVVDDFGWRGWMDSVRNTEVESGWELSTYRRNG